ncbi:MAG: VIT1/CCC1 transporter family protein [Candidatus Marsarchaeota archaeon]|nr:VIT1/CCC1 transporter family protein [Candidatus Marsarchaeota archaeon]
MDTKERDSYLLGLYREEVLHKRVYRKLAYVERDKRLKAVLSELSGVESYHATLWSQLVDVKGSNVSKLKLQFTFFMLGLLRRLFGLSVAIKAIEHREMELYEKIGSAANLFRGDAKRRGIISRIKADEQKREIPLQKRISEYSKVIENIRDITFGMNDGLVEVLAATVGLGAALQTPILVAIGGLIVAVSGTLSMAGGAYISTQYESGVRSKHRNMHSSPIGSAFYVGLPYIFGAAFPLAPFVLGFGGVAGIAYSMVLTAIVLAIVAALIAVVTNKSVSRRVATTLAISLGAAVVTILLGAYVRHVLHIGV